MIIEELLLRIFLLEDSDNIKKIVILNALMLIFGLLGEKRKINKTFSIMIGFIFFFGYLSLFMKNMYRVMKQIKNYFILYL